MHTWDSPIFGTHAQVRWTDGALRVAVDGGAEFTLATLTTEVSPSIIEEATGRWVVSYTVNGTTTRWTSQRKAASSTWTLVA
jgi:hypothetical protein